MIEYISFKRYNPYFKTALNDIVIEHVRNSNKPLFWLSGWDTDCINLGRTQDIYSVVDLQKVKEKNLLIVRRQGGGGVTYLSKEGELTWGFIAPKKFFPTQVNDIYKFICSKIIDVLNELGIKAFHKPINDVITQKGKISGSTLKKSDDVIYVGGTLLLNVDKKLLNEILKPENDTLKKKKIFEKNKKITSVNDEIDISFEKIIAAFEKIFLKEEFVEINLSKEELKKAKELSLVYGSKEWIYDGKTE